MAKKKKPEVKSLKIRLNPDADFPEVVDTIFDVLTGADIIEDSQDDGFQFTGFFDAAKVQPIVSEVIREFPQFIREFVAMSPSTAFPALEAAKDKFVAERGQMGNVTAAFYGGLVILANLYGSIDTIKALVEAWIDRVFGSNTDAA
jgi:hypothetical protein